MPKKSIKRPGTDETHELNESMILGVTADGECVYIHSFDDEIEALEFIEVMAAGLRADILTRMMRRTMN